MNDEISFRPQLGRVLLRLRLRLAGRRWVQLLRARCQVGARVLQLRLRLLLVMVVVMMMVVVIIVSLQVGGPVSVRLLLRLLLQAAGSERGCRCVAGIGGGKGGLVWVRARS